MARCSSIYFALVADPTTSTAQGPDSGTIQYRTAIFPTDA